MATTSPCPARAAGQIIRSTVNLIRLCPGGKSKIVGNLGINPHGRVVFTPQGEEPANDPLAHFGRVGIAVDGPDGKQTKLYPSDGENFLIALVNQAFADCPYLTAQWSNESG